MNLEVATMNIPELTVGAVIERLSSLYCSAIEKGVPFKALPTPFLWGSPGVGKSQGMYTLGRKIEAETGKKVTVTDVRLLLFNPVDLRGMPSKSRTEDVAVWLKPKIFQMDESPNTVNLLFLDELSAAPQSVQAAAYQICLDRRIGEHQLPDNCIVIAAGNKMTDQSVSYKMPKALCNRLMHFEICSDYSAWREWAVGHGISPLIIAFLGCNYERLCMEPSSSDLAFCTPRSWEFVSTLINTTDQSPEMIHELVSACVGIDTAIELEAFCRGTANMPSVDLILEGRCTDIPKSHDVMYALISAMTAKIIQDREKITSAQLENVFSYTKRLPNDFVMSLVKDIIRNKQINQKLMKCQGFQQWLSRNNVSL